MSWLYRNFRVRDAAPLAVAAASLALCVFARPAAAQEINFAPFGSATAEWDSNRSLARPPQSAGSYGGVVGADLRDLSPRSYMDLAAQISYTDIPQLGYDWTSGNVAFKSDVKTLNADYTLLADYRRDDAFFTEFGQAQFNNGLTLTSPDTNGTANVTTGITRESYEVDPGFDYNFTPRLDLEGDFRVNSVRYNIQAPGQRVDYTSPYAGLTLNYDTSQRSSIGIGPYYSHYQETNGNKLTDVAGGENTTDTEGVAFSYNYKTSDVTRMSVVLRVERDHIKALDFSPQSATGWGLEWVGTHKFQVGNVQFSIGRFLEPSSIGGRVTMDQFRAQVYRPLSARLSFTGAVRATHTVVVGNALESVSPPENRANAEMYLRFDITRTWYVTGGYIFARSVDLGESNLAYSNGVLLTVGYQALEPPRPVDFNFK
jgi:hypothetical protein